MELPSPLPSSFSSSSSICTTSSISTANAVLLEESMCDEPVSSSSTNQHQLDQCCSYMIPVSMDHTCQPAGHGSKKRVKLGFPDQHSWDKVAHVSPFPTLFSLQRKTVGQGLNCRDVSTIRDIEFQEKDMEEEELGRGEGCTTPPHLQICTCNAAQDRHDCKSESDEPPPMANNADLDAQCSEYEKTLSAVQAICSSADDGELGSWCQNIVGAGDGLERKESISISSYKCGCSCINVGRREWVPPPPPRKPKSIPRILKPSHLNFIAPPDLELFFSSTSTPAASTHDTQLFRQDN